MMIIAFILGLLILMVLIGWLVTRATDTNKSKEDSSNLPIYEDEVDKD